MVNVTQTFSDFDSALVVCGAGYNDSDIVSVVGFRATQPVGDVLPPHAINPILFIGIAAAEATDRPLTVLDFGGGCGFHYCMVAAAIRTPLRWAIVETPIMAEHATAVAQGRFDVFTDIGDAAAALGRVDIVHASGSIQYVRDPLATLQTLAALRARHFVLARFPWWDRAQIVGVQDSLLSGNSVGLLPPGITDRPIRYPITFTNYRDVQRTLVEYETGSLIRSQGQLWDYHIRGQAIAPEISVIFRRKKSPAK
jgi:putative methyltransferase (TIGR04325 family)